MSVGGHVNGPPECGEAASVAISVLRFWDQERIQSYLSRVIRG